MSIDGDRAVAAVEEDAGEHAATLERLLERDLVVPCLVHRRERRARPTRDRHDIALVERERAAAEDRPAKVRPRALGVLTEPAGGEYHRATRGDPAHPSPALAHLDALDGRAGSSDQGRDARVEQYGDLALADGGGELGDQLQPEAPGVARVVLGLQRAPARRGVLRQRREVVGKELAGEVSIEQGPKG